MSMNSRWRVARGPLGRRRLCRPSRACRVAISTATPQRGEARPRWSTHLCAASALESGPTREDSLEKLSRKAPLGELELAPALCVRATWPASAVPMLSSMQSRNQRCHAQAKPGTSSLVNPHLRGGRLGLSAGHPFRMRTVRSCRECRILVKLFV